MPSIDRGDEVAPSVDNMMQNKPETKRIIVAGILFAAIYSVGVFELGREIGQVESSEFFHRQLRSLRSLKDCGGHAKKLFGHVHMAKTAGTSINGIAANKFERVCGHKGYSYDAFHDNDKAANIVAKGGTPTPEGRSRVWWTEMDDIGYEDCDWVSNEVNYNWWIQKFGDNKFHQIPFEMHVPCRDPIDHLMSQCNYAENSGKFVKQDLACDAATDEEYFESVRACFVYLGQRYNHDLEKHFDVKCYDFKNQFGGYLDYLSENLEDRRYETEEYVRRETNDPRDKESECIWKRPDLLEKTRKYLIEHVDYYGFCDKCLGTEDEIGNKEAAVVA